MNKYQLLKARQDLLKQQQELKEIGINDTLIRYGIVQLNKEDTQGRSYCESLGLKAIILGDTGLIRYILE